MSRLIARLIALEAPVLSALRYVRVGTCCGMSRAPFAERNAALPAPRGHLTALAVA